MKRTVRAVLFLCLALLKKIDFCVKIKIAKYMSLWVYILNKGVRTWTRTIKTRRDLRSLSSITI